VRNHQIKTRNFKSVPTPNPRENGAARFWRSVTSGFLPLNAIEIAPILRTLAGVARTSPLQFRSINCNTTRLGPHEVDNGDSISRVCFNKSQLARYNIRPCPPPIPPRLHFLRTTPTESLISRSTFLSDRRCRNLSFYFRLYSKPSRANSFISTDHRRSSPPR
jgi:hypothetical protein